MKDNVKYRTGNRRDAKSRNIRTRKIIPSAQSIDSLTDELFECFGNRKIIGRLDLVYNTNTKEFYPVPKDIEHKDFTPTLGGIPESMIPVQLRYNTLEDGTRIITQLLVGASSYEAECGVRHDMAQLKEAYDQTIYTLLSGIEVRPERFQIFKKFANTQ